MTDLVAAPGRLLSRSTRRSPSAARCPPDGVIVDTGQLVGLPQRAVGRSGPHADLPHARARPDRRSGRRRRVARHLAQRTLRLFCAASASTRPRRWRSIRSSGGPAGCWRPTSATQELKFELVAHDRRPRADRDRVVQLPPGPLHADLRDRHGGWRRRAHRLRRLRARADHAGAVPDATASTSAAWPDEVRAELWP